MLTENVSTLKIHKLTQEQYDRELAAGNIDESALYLTPDEEIDLTPYATKDDLSKKADTGHTHDDRYYTETEIDAKVDELNSSIEKITGGTTTVKIAEHALLSDSATTSLDAEKLGGQNPSYYARTSDIPTGTLAEKDVVSESELDSDLVEKINVAFGGNHNHSNKTILDGITSTKVSAWDNAEANANAHTDEIASGKADKNHTHDDRYYTEAEIDSKIGSINSTISSHNHDSKYDAKGTAEAQAKVVDDKLIAHTDDTDIHVTTTNKSNWNTAYTHSQSTHARTDATKVADSTTNGNILINGTETNVYTHPNSGVIAGTYKSITVNAQGHITGGTNPTTLSGYGITDAESKGAASSALASAKEYTDSVASTKANTSHNHDSAYDAKGSASSALASAKSYADSAATTAANKVKNDLLNGAGAAYDTLSELGNLIDDNVDAIEALETVAANKSDKGHIHSFSEVSGLQSALDGKAATSHGTHVSYSTTAPVMDGTASVGSASTVARSDHKHPSDTSRASKTEFDSHTGDTTKHITSTERSNWNAAKSHADSAHAPSNAQANQNAFSNVKVGSTTIAADTTTDTLELVGSNVTITPDATNDKVTIAVADGSTSTKGIVQLTNSTSSTSTTTAATPSSVKSAYDLANTAKTAAANAQATADSKANASHTHNYAGSSSIGGSATSANKLNTNAGSSTKPVYFSNGVPAACTYSLGAELTGYSGSLASGGWKNLGGRSAGSKVFVGYNSTPANWNSSTYSSSIVFGASDTKGLLDCGYPNPIVTFGGSAVNASTDDAPTWYFKLAGTSGKTYTMPSDSGTLARTTDTVSGATKDGSGNTITSTYATKTELNTAKSTLQSSIDGKAASGHTHSYAGSSSAGGAATSANKVNSSLTVKLNGGSTEGTNLFTFNGSAAKSVNITPSSIGAAASSHTHDDRYYTESEVDSKLSGKANSSHGNHVPATQTANNAKFLRNDNTWQTVTPANIGAAAASHGNHVPTTQTANNATFLRNDNTWQKVTPANIGAVAQSSYDSHVADTAKHTDTKNTAGATNTSSKLYLIGATSQGSNPQTYSHDTAYVNDSGMLVSKDYILGNDTTYFRTGYKNSAKYTFPKETSKTYYVTICKNTYFEEQKFLFRTLGNNTQFVNLVTINARNYMGATIHGQTLKYNGSEITEIAVYKNATATYNHNVVLTIKTNPTTTTELHITSDGGFTLDSTAISTTAPTETKEASYIPTESDTIYTTGTAYIGGSLTVKSTITGNLSGNASTATNVAWSGVTSKPSYYDAKAIKGITRSGTTFTYTCMDGTTGTFTQQDNNTTYSAATSSALGLVKIGSNITNSSGTISLTKANVTSALGYTPPTSDTNTHYTTRIYAGASGTAANAAATSPYIKITDDNTYRNQIRLVGGGSTTVTSDANGNITISSTDTNTTYSAATQSAQGLMSAADKKKLDGIASGANAYSLPTASSSTLGGVKTTSTVTSTSGLTACPIISGVPYYKDTNTTYSLSSFGITATATELNYTDGVTSNIQTQLNGKAASSHTHSYLPLSGGTVTGATTFNSTVKIGNATISYDSTNKRMVISVA